MPLPVSTLCTPNKKVGSNCLQLLLRFSVCKPEKGCRDKGRLDVLEGSIARGSPVEGKLGVKDCIDWCCELFKVGNELVHVGNHVGGCM